MYMSYTRNPPPQFSRLGIRVSLAIYVCLSGLWLGGLFHLSFLSYSFKLVCYTCICTCISMYMYLHVHLLSHLYVYLHCCSDWSCMYTVILYMYIALFVCLTLLASFFLPSHLSFKNMYMYIIIITCICVMQCVLVRCCPSHPWRRRVSHYCSHRCTSFSSERERRLPFLFQISIMQ